jgi:polar amino acid transport system substrate-binding protein
VEEDTVKAITRLAALSAVSLLVAACGGGGASGAPSRAAASASATQAAPTAEASLVTIAPPTDLIEAGTLTDCVDIEYPPMEFFPPDVTDPNQAIGFDVDAAKAVADRFGLEIEIRSTAFNALIADLQAGRCDIVWSALYIDDERLEVADAVPYMATGQVVMVAIGNPPGIAQVTDLCGKSVSIQGGGLVERRINRANADCEAAGSDPIDIKAYGTVAEELQQIISGRVDAVWETDTAVSNFILEHPNEYEVAYALPRDDNYGVYYEKGNTDVGDALTAAIAALKDDGTLATIAQTYAMDPAILEVVE